MPEDMGIVKKLDTYTSLSLEERVELGKALFETQKSKGWEMLAALLRQTQASAALASLYDNTEPPGYYKGMVSMVDLINTTIRDAVYVAKETVEKERDAGASARVLAMLKPGGGGL